MYHYEISMDKAELVSVLLEAILYGFSFLMFLGTLWTLFTQRSTHRVNRTMLAVTFALLVLSTAHLAIHIIRTIEGLILLRDTYPGGPIEYFADVSQWTFVYKNLLYTGQSLIGDGVILYRCYSVWQSTLVMIFPALLWCATGVTAIASSYTTSKGTQNGVFDGVIAQWITSFWATALATNLLTTVLLAYRIWYVDRKTRRLDKSRKSHLWVIFRIIVDAGVIYSVVLLAALVCFVKQSNIQYITLDMVTPIISITFYMVIIRVGLAKRANCSAATTLGYPHTGNSPTSTDRRRRMQVHITTLTESRIEHNQPSLYLMNAMENKSHKSEPNFDNMEAV